MNCPNCGRPVPKPKPGTIWRHCAVCHGWFYWDRSPISCLILDMLETFPGEWFTQSRLCEHLVERRPGLKAESVKRSIRVLKSRGSGLAGDRLILSTSSGGERLGPRRRITIECSTRSPDLIRVLNRDYQG